MPSTPLRGLALAVIFLLFSAVAATAATKLTVYTAVEPDLLARYADAFTAKNPDITIAWVRDSTGPIAARLLAEKDAPKADVIFGLALSALVPLGDGGLLEPYRPEGLERMSPGSYDASGDAPLWIGMNSWGSILCVNTRELEKKGLPEPKGWQDLTRPEYKGFIVAPTPVSSNNMYINVSAWLQTLGEEEAWLYMDELDANVKMYTHSGCKPGQMVAQGEIPIGIAASACIHAYNQDRVPLKAIYPAEGSGYDFEACALIKDGKHKDAAKKLLDFCTSKEVAKVALDTGYIPARADMLTEEARAAKNSLLPVDPVQSAVMRREVVEKWRARYSGSR